LPGDSGDELIVLVHVAPRDIQELDIESSFEALGRCVAIETVAVDQVTLGKVEVGFLRPSVEYQASRCVE